MRWQNPLGGKASTHPRLAVGLAGIALCCSALPLRAQGFGELGIELSHNDNLPRAQFAGDRHGDAAALFSASGGWHFQPGDYTGLSVIASLRASRFDQYSGLDNIEPAVNAQLTHKFGLGERAPVLTLGAALSQSSFDNDIRDASNHALTLSLGRRFGERWQHTATMRYDASDGDHALPKPGVAKPGNVWDQHSWTLALQSEFDLSDVSWLSASLSLRRGDIVSSGTPNPTIAAAAKAITLDPVFGSATAYRIDASTRTLAVDYNYAVGESGTWYIGVERQLTHGSSGIDYGVGLLRTGVIFSF